MGKISIDLKAHELIHQSIMSDYAAQQALLTAANYLDVEHTGSVTLPNNIAKWLGRAIKKAMSAPRSQWPKALTDELGLTAPKPRPAVDWYALGQFIEEKMDDDGLNQTKAFECAIEKFRVSENTVKKYYKIYKKAFDEIAEINRENDEWERSK